MSVSCWRKLLLDRQVGCQRDKEICGELAGMQPVQKCDKTPGQLLWHTETFAAAFCDDSVRTLLHQMSHNSNSAVCVTSTYITESKSMSTILRTFRNCCLISSSFTLHCLSSPVFFRVVDLPVITHTATLNIMQYQFLYPFR